MFGPFEIAALVFIGLMAGMIGGLLGVGGSIIMIPGMDVVLGAGRQHLYQASAMIVNIFVAAPAAVQHWRFGAVLRPIIRWLVPGAMVGVLAGVALSNQPIFHGVNEVRLAWVFGALLAYVTIYNIVRLVRGNRLPQLNEASVLQLPPARVALVGAGMGLAAGLTGVGGGALAVPMQQIFLRMPLPNAIANSACTICFSALIGAIYKNATLARHDYTLWQSFIIAAALIPSAFVGSWIGAMLTHRLPRKPVRIIFILFLLAGAVRMFVARPRGEAVPGPTTQPAASAEHRPASPQPG